MFSKDSKHVAYVASDSDRKWFMVVDGKEGKRCDGIAPYIMRFNPDTHEVMYIAQIGDKWFLQWAIKKERHTMIFSLPSQ